MKQRVCTALLLFGMILAVEDPALPQTPAPDPNPAMNAPDQLAWQLFIQVNTRAGGPGNNALFETWASDTDTFTTNPQFPTTPTPLALHPPVVPAIGRQVLQESGALLPAVPPDPDLGEESRRNKSTFDFIVQNNLYKITGLRAAFGKALSFPIDSVEVKANWKPVASVPAFTLNRVALADVPKFFHVNTGVDGKQYALVAMHVISKLVPNWTWATFENQFNPARCDVLGCKDNFGATQANVTPNSQAGRGYPACAKTQALTTMISAANWDSAFENYCLKGSQTDFTDNSGLDIRNGNSITEDGFVNRASCMTCHGRAAWDSNGKATSQAGFDTNGLAPLGPINPSWYWSFSASPPIYEGMPGLTRTGTGSDFIWSVPFCAIDDTVTPPSQTSCAGK
jgi:hypothetical protein